MFSLITRFINLLRSKTYEAANLFGVFWFYKTFLSFMFKKQKQTIHIGIIGTANSTQNNSILSDLISKSLATVEQKFKNRYPLKLLDFELLVIISKHTNSVNRFAAEEARKRKWKTVGICDELSRHVLENFSSTLDQTIVSTNTIGDETNKFLEKLDLLIHVGSSDDFQKEIQFVEEQRIEVLEIEL